MSQRRDDEQLLEALLCGELAEDDPRVHAAFERDPALRLEYRELRSEGAELEREFASVERELAARLEEIEPEDREVVRRALRARDDRARAVGPDGATGNGAGAARRDGGDATRVSHGAARPTRRGWLLVAASIALISIVGYFATRSTKHDEGSLGWTSPLVVEAQGAGFVLVLGTPPADGDFLVRVYSATADGERRRLHEATTTLERWELPLELARRTSSGERLEVVVQARESSGPVGAARRVFVP
ncbi:MAG: hypothetical protein IPJ77_14735 [Planctomycetes bacterium]|nr:hypothetical protein [Planctomycetota bacterium]